MCRWLTGLLLCAWSAAIATAAPTVTVTSPTRNVLAPGQSVNLSVSATGSGTVTYQWLRKGNAIVGATSDSLAISSATFSDDGWYLCDATDSSGTTRSAPLFVLVVPTVTQVRSWNSSSIENQQVFSGTTDTISLAFGGSNNVRLKHDGTIQAQSSYYNGPTAPIGLDNVVAIASRYYLSIALKSDGTVWEWSFGAPTAVSVSNVVAIASGDSHSLALKSDGTVFAWGSDSAGQVTVPAGLSNVVSVACGDMTSYALKSDGTVVAWGDNSYGVVPSLPLTGVVAISTLSTHVMALKADGTVAMAGSNYTGASPYVPSGLANVAKVAAGKYIAAALKVDGSLETWGMSQGAPAGMAGAFAIFGTTNLTAFALRDASNDTVPVVTVTPGSQTVTETQSFTLTAVASGGGPFTYQWRKNGTPINGATAADLAFTSVGTPDAGNYDAMVSNYVGTTTSAVTTLTVTALPAVGSTDAKYKILNPGQGATLVPTYSGPGALNYQWYRNGRIVAGATGSTFVLPAADYSDAGYYVAGITDANGTQRSEPIFVNVAPALTQVRSWGSTQIPASVTDVIALASGSDTVLALKNNGVVAEFGPAGSRQPPELTGVVAVAASNAHSLALRKDGTVVAWGSNASGQASVPAGLAQVVSVKAGDGYSLALKTDGTVIKWGSGGYPVPDGLTGVVAIAAGSQQAVALKADGTVVVWGSSTVAGAPDGLSGVVDISAPTPGIYTVALRSDGTLVAWGYASSGETTIPSGLSSVRSARAGTYHSVALKADGSIVCWGRSQEGQTTPPAGLTDVFAIAAGYTSSYVIRDATADAPPVIAVPPSSQTQPETGQVIFSVSATGAGPLSYQWRKGGSAIAGATTASLRLVDLALTDAGSYDVVVSNHLGSTPSAAGVLTVNAIPVVTSLSPTRQVIASGQGVNLSVTATGTGSLSYQWTHGGRPIPGATNAALSLTNFTRQSAGCYLVHISDSNGTRISNPIFLIFLPGTGPAPLTQVRAWGTPSVGLHDIPPGLDDVVDIAITSYMPLALRANGTLVTWGTYGPYFPLPVGLTGVVAIALSESHRAAVKSDGTVVAWGDNSYKQCDVPAGLSDVVSVACGNGYTLALKADGTVVGWGGNYTNQTPYNPAYAQNVPAGLKNVVAILALPSQGLALRSDGTFVTWSGASWDPGLLIHEEYSDVIVVTGSPRYGLLKRDGTVQVVPNNYYDNVPYVPAGLNNVVALHGTDSLFAVKADGSVVAWRLSSAVELPDGIPHVIKITDMSGGGLVLRDASADAPPVLSTLTDRTQGEGQPVSWSCAAAGAGPFTYQWRKDGANITSATSSTLNLPSVLPADAGSYDLVVTNYKGVTTSNAVMLTVLRLPVITVISPTRQVFDPGQNMTLNVAATGTGPLTYQWFHNGHAIPGANSTGFSASNLSLQDGGWYLVDVTDNNGNRRSQSMFVVVAPTVTKVHVWGDYVDKLLALKPAYTDIISVSLSSDGYFAYGIRRNGTVVNWGEPNGFALPPVPAGLTDVVAIQVDGLIALKSDGTVVSIGNQPSANADVLAGLSNVVSIEASNGVSFALKYDGTVVAWSPDLAQRDVTNVPPGLDHVVALAAGNGYALALKDNGTVVGWGVSNYPDLPSKAIPSDLTDVIAINAGAGGIALRSGGLVTQWGWNGRHDYPAYTHWPVDVDDTLKVIYNDGEISPQLGNDYSYTTPQPKTIRNLYKIARRGSAVLALSGESAPLVTLDPVNVTQREAQKVMLAVAATGLEPLTFQWRKNGTAISGATSATLIFDEVAPTDAGGYDAVITNSLGSATSKAATLTVIPVPVITSLSPTRNVMNSGQDFSLNVSATGTGALDYQWSHDGHDIAGASQSSLHLANISPADNGWYNVSITDQNGTRRSPTIFLTVVPAQTRVRAWGDAALTVPASVTDVVAIAAGNSHATAIRRDGTVVEWGSIWQSGSSSVAVVVQPVGLTDVVAVSAGYGSTLALKSDGTVVGWGLNDSGQVTIPAGLTDVVKVSTDGHSSLALKSNGTVVAWGDNYWRQSTVPSDARDIVDIAAGWTYSYAVRRNGIAFYWGGWNLGPNSAPNMEGSYLKITPGLALRSDHSVYDWRYYDPPILPPSADLGDAIAISTGNSSSMMLKTDLSVLVWGAAAWGGTPPADLHHVVGIASGGYFALALVEVIAPVILAQPASQTVIDGNSVTLTVVASGIPVPTYQWRRNGANISGATNSSLTIANPTANAAGKYTVVASNEVGSVESNVAWVVTDTVMPAAFDINAYLGRYPDVAAVFGADYRSAWLYYLNQGIYQGEVFDELFRVEEYLSLYPDLATLFGSDLGGALIHWLTEGSIEGRLGRIPLEFNAQGYFDRNTDVATAVGNDPILAWGHYWLYGIYEGRAYDDELRVFEYLAINADLTTAFVNDWRQAALHWMRYGRTEGRLGRLPLTFNVTEYLVRSPDVAAVWGTNPTTVFLHFWAYGIDESRTYDDLFRPVEYLALNPDLAAVLGTDRRLAFKHWVRYGQTEGRPGRNP